MQQWLGDAHRMKENALRGSKMPVVEENALSCPSNTYSGCEEVEDQLQCNVEVARIKKEAYKSRGRMMEAFIVLGWLGKEWIDTYGVEKCPQKD